jgi:hypothetical protein
MNKRFESNRIMSEELRQQLAWYRASSASDHEDCSFYITRKFINMRPKIIHLALSRAG